MLHMQMVDLEREHAFGRGGQRQVGATISDASKEKKRKAGGARVEPTAAEHEHKAKGYAGTTAALGLAVAQPLDGAGGVCWPPPR